MRMVQTAAVLPVLLSSLLMSSPSGAASVQIEDTGKAAIIYVNSGAVLSLRTDNGGLSALQRAGVAAKRISDFVTAGQPVAKINSKATQGGAALYWGQQAIAFATTAEAKAQNSSPLALATVWAGNLRKQLTLPPIKISSRSMTIPIGENRQSTLIGFSTTSRSVTVEPAAIASAKIEGDSLIVQGLRDGAAVVTVGVPEGSDSITIEVGRYAGRLPSQPIVAEVSGSSIPSDIVGEAAWRAARAAVILEKGAIATVSLVDKSSGMDSNTLSKPVAVNVRIEGSGYLTASLSTTVEIRRRAFKPDNNGTLLYSNHPEQVPFAQPLFTAPLDPTKSARLLYHHQNGTGSRLRVSVMVVNLDDQPASLHLIAAKAGPVMDTILVGYKAGADFLRDLAAGTGYVLTVPARSRVILWTGVLDKMETASGIIQMQQLTNSGKLITRVLSEPASVVRTVQDVTLAQDSDFVTRYSEQQFPTIVREISEEFTAGDRWVFIRMGKHAIRDAAGLRVLDGNYGVSYDINLRLKNPTPEVKTVTVMFDPTAGIAGIATMIDGQYYGKSHVSGTRELPLAKIRLNPGETREVPVTTIPLAGSHYPASLVVRS